MDSSPFLHEPKASSRDQETSCDDPRHCVNGVTAVA
jgi:hypothetical protein